MAAYRFSDRHFHSYANYIDHKYNDADAQDEKQTISLSFGQPITPLNLNLYANILHQSWWNADTSTTANITAGFNVDIGDWKDISVSTSFNTTHYEDKDRDNQIYFSISLPIGESGRLGYDMQNNSNTTTHRMSWNDTPMNETVGECRLEYNPIARITVRRSAAITNTSVRRGMGFDRNLCRQ